MFGVDKQPNNQSIKIVAKEILLYVVHVNQFCFESDRLKLSRYEDIHFFTKGECFCCINWPLSFLQTRCRPVHLNFLSIARQTCSQTGLVIGAWSKQHGTFRKNTFLHLVLRAACPGELHAPRQWPVMLRSWSSLRRRCTSRNKALKSYSFLCFPRHLAAPFSVSGWHQCQSSNMCMRLHTHTHTHTTHHITSCEHLDRQIQLWEYFTAPTRAIMCNMLANSVARFPLLSFFFFFSTLNLLLFFTPHVRQRGICWSPFSYWANRLSKRPSPMPLCCHLPVIRLCSTVGAKAAQRLSP